MGLFTPIFMIFNDLVKSFCDLQFLNRFVVFSLEQYNDFVLSGIDDLVESFIQLLLLYV